MDQQNTHQETPEKPRRRKWTRQPEGGYYTSGPYEIECQPHDRGGVRTLWDLRLNGQRVATFYGLAEAKGRVAQYDQAEGGAPE